MGVGLSGPVVLGLMQTERAGAFALLGVLADGDVDAIFVDDGRGDDLAGAAGCAVFLLALLGGIDVAAPEFLEVLVEAVAEAVASAEDDLVFSVDGRERGGRPVAEQSALGDAGGFLGEELAGFFIEADEGGRIRRGSVDAGPVLAVGGGDVKFVADDEDRAAGHVERYDAQLVAQVVAPDEVAVGFLQGDRGVFLAGLILGLVGKGAVVAVGLAVHVYADDFAAVGHEIGAIAIDGG